MKIFKIYINVCIDINAIKFSGNNFIEIIQKLYNKIFNNFKLCKKNDEILFDSVLFGPFSFLNK